VTKKCNFNVIFLKNVCGGIAFRPHMGRGYGAPPPDHTTNLPHRCPTSDILFKMPIHVPKAKSHASFNLVPVK